MTFQITPPRLEMVIETENPSYTGEPSAPTQRPLRNAKAGDDVVPSPYCDPSAPLYFTLPPTIEPSREPRGSRRNAPIASREVPPEPA